MLSSKSDQYYWLLTIFLYHKHDNWDFTSANFNLKKVFTDMIVLTVVHLLHWELSFIFILAIYKCVINNYTYVTSFFLNTFLQSFEFKTIRSTNCKVFIDGIASINRRKEVSKWSVSINFTMGIKCAIKYCANVTSTSNRFNLWWRLFELNLIIVWSTLFLLNIKWLSDGNIQYDSH